MAAVAKRASHKAQISIVDACLDENLFQPWFKDLETWTGWFAFMRAVFGLPMNSKHRSIYDSCTERSLAPTKPFKEAWLVVGRRGGKSRVLALIAVYLAVFYDYSQFLSPGERGKIVIVATDRRQARVIFRYIEAFLKNVSLLENLIERETMEVFELSNNIDIEIHTASFRGIRGYTIVAALLDELAFWRAEDSSNPDEEILAAIRPAMATIPNAMLLCASSPYARRGALYTAFDKYFGENNEEVLVWKSPTWVMNPSVSQEYLDDQYERDPARARAEYGAEFRTDVETFLPIEILDACVIPSRYEQAYIEAYEYSAFVDPSGGSKDSFALAIAHDEEELRVIDVLRERRPPFSPEEVVADFCKLMKSYNISTVYGDRYGGEWPRERFRKHGITYEVCQKTKSDLYLEFLPLVMAKQIELLESKRMIKQFIELERRTSRGGKDSIDHPVGGYDDLANVVAGVVNESHKSVPLDTW